MLSTPRLFPSPALLVVKSELLEPRMEVSRFMEERFVLVSESLSFVFRSRGEAPNEARPSEPLSFLFKELPRRVFPRRLPVDERKLERPRSPPWTKLPLPSSNRCVISL